MVGAVGIGAITNLVGFFFIAFLFAGADGDVWVRTYFGTANGAYFMVVTLIIAVIVFPLTIKMKIARK